MAPFAIGRREERADSERNADTLRQGALRSYDGYHKRHKLLYDDSADEWVALARQRFRWLTPRGRSAGARLSISQTSEVEQIHLAASCSGCMRQASMRCAQPRHMCFRAPRQRLATYP